MGQDTSNDYFKLQRRMLRAGGISLRGEESTLYKIYSGGVHLLLIIYILILIFDVIYNVNDQVTAKESMYYIMGLVSVFSKLVLMSHQGKQLGETLKMLESGVFSPKPDRGGPEEQRLVNRCIRESKYQITVSWMLAVCGTFIPLIACMVMRIFTQDSEQWLLPYGKFSIFKPFRSPNYELAWLVQCIICPIGTIIHFSVDFLIVGIFGHICVQFKILNNSIKTMVGETDEDEDKKSNTTSIERFQKMHWEYLSGKLKENVLYHLAIIDLAKKIQEKFNALLSVNYVINAIVLSYITYHLSLYNIVGHRVYKDIMMVFAAIFDLLLVCYYGDEIILESQKLLRACYKVDFVGIDIKFQKGLVLVMTRAQQPIKFTAGKSAVLALTFFVSVVRASLSYCMVLRRIYKMR